MADIGAYGTQQKLNHSLKMFVDWRLITAHGSPQNSYVYSLELSHRPQTCCRAIQHLTGALGSAATGETEQNTLLTQGIFDSLSNIQVWC